MTLYRIRCFKERDALRAFAQGILEAAAVDISGFDVQGLAEKHGLLSPVEVSESCGETCNCAQYADFPMTCYRWTPLLTG